MSAPASSFVADTPWAPAGLAWRWLAPDDLAALHALHLRSIAGMAVQAVKPETRDFLQSVLDGRGRIVGAHHQGALVAYGVLQHALGEHDDPRALLGLDAALPLRKLAGAAVDARWRGQGLQRNLIQRRMAAAEGAALFATAAPCNPPSWRSLLACGLMVRALQFRYGGHARYLVARAPQDGWRSDGARAIDLGPHELPRQQALLAQGWRGVAPGTTAHSLRLAPPAPDTAPAGAP